MQKTRKAKVKEIEGHLRNYQAYKVGILNIDEQLNWIMPGITASYSASEGTCGTFNISSKVEDAVLDRLESKQALDLREEKARYELIVGCIDRAIDQLDEIEKEFVQLRYFKKKRIPEVADHLGYHEKHLHKIRNNIMDKLLISLSNILKLG